MKTNYQPKRVAFGATGLEVTKLSFGAMNLRMMNSIEESEKLVHYVLDQKINLIDTARAYNGTNQSGQEVESERIVGSVIAARRDIDEPLIVVTKGHGYTPDVFDEHLAESRKALGVENRDGELFIGSTKIKLVYFYHAINEERLKTITEHNTIAHALQRKQEGLFSYLGFSSHTGDGPAIQAALDTGAFSVVELPYNIYSRKLGSEQEFDYLKYAYEKGVAVINMKPFLGNGFAHMYKTAKEVCEISHKEMLEFCLANPYSATIDAGARSIEEFQFDLEVERRFIQDPEVLEENIRKADLISENLNGLCRECMHCLEKFECPMGIDFPAILGQHARYSFASSIGKDTSVYRESYSRMEKGADECVACGQCLEWCEYHLNIPEMMEVAHRDLSIQK